MHPNLLQSQKKTVFQSVENAGLSPTEFEWIMDKKGYSSDPGPVLEHQRSGYYFLFCTPESGNDSWQYKCAPGMGNPADSDLYEEGWPRILQRVHRWCADLKQELAEPDLWGAVRPFDLDTFRIDADRNDAFTFAEVVEIKDKLKALVGFVENESTTNNQLANSQAQILASIERLEVHAESGLGRLDWEN